MTGSPTPIPDEANASITRLSGDLPLYERVRRELETMVLALPFDHDDPLPPEAKLSKRWGVSRGTLRHAVDELARTGLLHVEQGRGTFVNHEVQIRLTVWDQLREVALPDSRFHLDLEYVVPDFVGREACDDRIMMRPEWKTARSVFIAPDNSLEQMRANALLQGKRLVVPTFGLRRGYVLLDPTDIPPEQIPLAATLDGMERCGSPVVVPVLEAVGKIDLLLTGAVAVSGDGQHIGPGNRFFSTERRELEETGVIDAVTPLIVAVHDCQVVEGPVSLDRTTRPISVIVTPTRTIDLPQTNEAMALSRSDQEKAKSIER